MVYVVFILAVTISYYLGFNTAFNNADQQLKIVMNIIANVLNRSLDDDNLRKVDEGLTKELKEYFKAK